MTQDAREATIELLFLSLYLDNHLSLAEDETLNTALDSLGWESAVPLARFIFPAFATARGVYLDETKTSGFLSSRAARIKDAGAEGEALTWLYRVLSADGLTQEERRFLARLEKLLYP